MPCWGMYAANFSFNFWVKICNVVFNVGHRKEKKRGSGTPPEESEEWDYEEGHSPAPDVKEQQTSSRYSTTIFIHFMLNSGCN